MNDFDKLLSELTAAQADNDTLAKSLTQQGGEGGEQGAGATEADAGKGNADDGGNADGGEESLTKSFKLKLDDGTEVEAIDGAKALEDLTKRIEQGEGTMHKAMGGVLTLVKSQGALIKSLVEEVKALRGEGRGRRAVLSVVEKTPAGTLAKSSGAEEALGVQEFLAKSEAAWGAGKITGQEFNTIDVACRLGTEVDPSLIKKVLNGVPANKA